MPINASTTYIIDFDSTLVAVESLDAFAETVLKTNPDRQKIQAKLQAITDQGMAGEIPFDVSLSARLKLFRAHRDNIAPFTDWLAMQISASVMEQKDWFQSHAENIFIVSGGFEEFIVPVVCRLGILEANVYANKFVFDSSGNITGHDTGRSTAHAGGKVAQVRRQLKLNQRVIAIGDGYTDLEIRLQGVADEFWAYTETVARPQVTAHADRIVGNFQEII